MEYRPDIFGRRLKQGRKIRKFSQSELAKKTGLQPSAISHFENNRRNPSLKNLCLICSALNIAPSWFLFDAIGELRKQIREQNGDN